jgi:probable F420-dependent oxidoreductase
MGCSVNPSAGGILSVLTDVKIGIRLPVYGAFPTQNPYDHLHELVAKADQGGVDSVWVVDHHLMPDESIRAAGAEPPGHQPLEAWTTLAAVAAWSKHPRIGTEVTPMIRSHPSILAKVTATLDQLSKGRLILGAGAGWYPPEFRNFGLTWNRLNRRYEQMVEAIEVVEKLWTEDKADYEGRYYRLSGASLYPKPIQKPHPPIWFGGVSDRILDSTVRYGDGWIPANNTAPQEYQTLVDRLASMAKQAGRRPETITVAAPFTAQIASSHDEAERTVQDYGAKAAGSSSDQTSAVPSSSSSWNSAFSASRLHGIWGSPEEAVQRIQKYIDLGAEHFILDLQPPKTSSTTLELLCNEVIPKIKRR